MTLTVTGRSSKQYFEEIFYQQNLIRRLLLSKLQVIQSTELGVDVPENKKCPLETDVE